MSAGARASKIRLVPFDKTRSTLSIESDPGAANVEDRLVVRWCHPQPPLAPTWLTRGRITFGRDRSCTVPLDSGYVSRQHAAITRSGPLWIVADLSSKNGVAINGTPVREHVLVPGDVLRLGDLVGVCLAAPPDADLSSATLQPGIFGGFRLRQSLQRLRELAPTDLPVVFEGETGTGKETFARALHLASGRPGPFLAVNCAVYSKAMAAAELFGYRKGAFTGAESPHLGHVRAAQGGTLLLDELTELSPEVQAMLLRVLENREVMPLGDARPVPIDVRFAAATQIPLRQAVSSGLLRPDLRARLEGGVIELAPLRISRETVVETFLSMIARHTGRAMALGTAFAEGLTLHPWTLNLRELDTVARRVAVACRSSETLDREFLDSVLGPTADGDRALGALGQVKPSRRSRKPRYSSDEIEALGSALNRFAGNLTQAAAELGLSRAKAYRMLRVAGEIGVRNPGEADAHHEPEPVWSSRGRA